ncbi:hypothetical protein ACLOJK_028713 [Asimina triloba]
MDLLQWTRWVGHRCDRMGVYLAVDLGMGKDLLMLPDFAIGSGKKMVLSELEKMTLFQATHFALLVDLPWWVCRFWGCCRRRRDTVMAENEEKMEQLPLSCSDLTCSPESTRSRLLPVGGDDEVAGSHRETLSEMGKKISPLLSLSLLAGDGGDRLQLRWFWNHVVMADLLNGSDQPIEASPVVCWVAAADLDHLIFAVILIGADQSTGPSPEGSLPTAMAIDLEEDDGAPKLVLRWCTEHGVPAMYIL